MARIPAVCESCHILFPFDMGPIGVRGLTLEGNLTRCPKCGGRASIVDGTYDIVEGIVQIVSAPGSSEEVLREMLAKLVEAERSGRSAESVADEIERIDPKLAKAIRKLHGRRYWAGAILLALALKTSININVSADLTRLADSIAIAIVEMLPPRGPSNQPD